MTVAAASSEANAPRIIAFYLPQFHPIPENDAWWGSGFTEWTKVVRARPLFPGHYQPHLPTTLGFYDLRVPEVREAQAAMARLHGIDGFCYYHYWLSGRRPFGRIMDEILTTGYPDLPFCLCWANHNWTRTWDGAEHEVLLREEYSEDDDRRHIAHLVPFLCDDRYIHVDGRPLLLIYQAHALPHPVRTFETWREHCADAGLPEPLIVKFDTQGNFDDPSTLGCDAAAQFLPHGMTENVPPTRVAGARADHLLFDYEEVVAAYQRADRPSWKRYECVFPSWDNTPRRAELGALTVVDNTPELFERWLRSAYERAGRDGIVFINAWNEWGEGTHLEPDERWGDAFLEAVARVTGKFPAMSAIGLNLSTQYFPAQPTFARLYHDLYEAYVRVQRNLTALERTVERSFHTALEDEASDSD